jgi:hypothetical protein
VTFGGIGIDKPLEGAFDRYLQPRFIQ